MKNFKKIMGIILVLCLVITQFPVTGSKIVKAAGSEGTKTDITSSKLSFTYEKTGEGEPQELKYCETDVNNFNGNGEYVIENAGQLDNGGYQNIGYFSCDTQFIVKNVVLTVNETYEFSLGETLYCWEDNQVYKVNFPNMWEQKNEGDVLYTSTDKKAKLVFGGNNVPIYLEVSNDDNQPGNNPQEPSGIKTKITSSKLSFTYEKTGEGEPQELKYCETDVNNFNGNGEYVIENAGQLDNGGYQNIGYFSCDTQFIVKNVVLTVNETYEFLLGETLYCWEDNQVYKVNFPNMWDQKNEDDVLYISTDKKAKLVFGGNNVPIYLEVSNDDNPPENPDDGDNPPQNPDDGDDNPPENPGDGDNENPSVKPDNVKTNITSSKLLFTYQNTGETEATSLTFYNTDVNGFNGNGDYEIVYEKWMYDDTEKGNGYENIGYFTCDAGYVLKNITLVINDTYEFLLEEEKYSWYNEDEQTNKSDLANIWGGYKDGDIIYTSKDKKATLVFCEVSDDIKLISLYVSNKTDDSNNPGGGDDNQNPGDDNQKPGDGDTQEPDRVQVNIKSSKLSFTYEKTGETDATFLKVSGTDVIGFNGNGTYEIDIAESAWNTWDKTGYYNLGFVSSDSAYTLKNVVVTVNGTYEFVLYETISSSYNEEEKLYKTDFVNMWSGHKEGDVLYTSKDGKAALVSGGNTAVISLMVDKTAVPTLKPFLPPYAISSPTTAPVTTAAPTVAPTTAPTVAPTVNPTVVPTTAPAVPTVNPTTVPTAAPVATVAPTKEPVTAPSSKPEEPSNKTEVIQKGDNVTVSGQKYEVTNNSKKTVAYVAAKNSKKSVTVPATVKVKVDGKNVIYKVTSIKDKAFKGNKKIKTVTVSKNIISIGKSAFKNCGKLKTIVIKSKNITKVGKNALKGTAKNLVIKVPASKVSAYKKLFKNKGNNSIIIKKA